MKPGSPIERSHRDPDAPAHGALARLGAFLVLDRLDWVMTLVAAIVLAAGGLFLSIAWQAGPQVAVRHAQYAAFTGHADATIVESWLALDVDTARIASAENWRASARATPCVTIELPGEWDAGRRRGLCGNTLGFSDAYDVPFLHEMSPHVPFVWMRDTRGFAVTELRLSPQALAWLDLSRADTFMHRKWPAKTALAWLKLELDRPIDQAIAGWSAPAPLIRVDYDPNHPEVQLPHALIEARLAHRPSWVLPIVIGVIGIALWIGGMMLLPAMGNFNVPGRVVLTLLPLVTLPWWGERFPQALRVFSAPLAEVAGDMFDDIDPLDRFASTDPQDALLAHGVRIAWHAGGGPYADTFGRLPFTPPAASFASADRALEALAASATESLRALPPGERAEFFERVRRDKLLDLRAAGLIAVPAAREALIDADTDPRVRNAARAFLVEWTTSPTEEPDPHLPALDERRALRDALADVPVPEIANMVRHP
jgi:hypothetical protein